MPNSFNFIPIAEIWILSSCSSFFVSSLSFYLFEPVWEGSRCWCRNCLVQKSCFNPSSSSYTQTHTIIASSVLRFVRSSSFLVGQSTISESFHPPHRHDESFLLVGLFLLLIHSQQVFRQFSSRGKGNQMKRWKKSKSKSKQKVETMDRDPKQMTDSLCPAPQSAIRLLWWR